MKQFYLILLLSFFLYGCTSTEKDNLANEDLLSSTNILATTHITNTLPVSSTLSTPNITEAPDMAQITSTPTATPSLGMLNIVSEPEGASIMIEGIDIIANTPYSVTLPSGTYKLTLTLDGYNLFTEPVDIVSDETVSINATLTYRYHYIPLEKVDDNHSLMHLDWDQNGTTLIYAMENGFYSPEQKDWVWWRYDLLTEEKTQLSPPESRVTEGVRQQLNLCPSDHPGEFWSEACPGYSLLLESPNSDHIVFAPLTTGDGKTWLASIDGSNAKELEELNVAPTYVQWSSDGQWLIISTDLAGPIKHYLVSTDGSFVKDIGLLTNTTHFFITGLFPQFSPDGQKLTFVGSEVPGSRNQDDYKLYVLNLSTFETYPVSEHFGFFQWAGEGNGIYILDEAVYPIASDEEYLSTGELAKRSASLYYADLTKFPPQEYLIAGNIFYYPQNSAGTWLWTYSPTTQAIAYVGFQDNEELGILLLNP